MKRQRIRFKNDSKEVSVVTAVVLLRALADNDREVAACMTLDTVDDLIDMVIDTLEDARNHRYLVERLEEP